jgi:hypothetical protein
LECENRIGVGIKDHDPASLFRDADQFVDGQRLLSLVDVKEDMGAQYRIKRLAR